MRRPDAGPFLKDAVNGTFRLPTTKKWPTVAMPLKLLKWATDNKASVATLRAEKKRRDSGDVAPEAGTAAAVPDDQLTPDAKLFRDFLKCVDGKPRMTLTDIMREMSVSVQVAGKLVFAATVHPAVDVVTKGRGTGNAFVVDWEEQSASDRIDKLHNKPQLKRLDDQLEQVIDSALSLIDGFYHAHRSSFQRIRPKDHRRLMTRSEVCCGSVLQSLRTTFKPEYQETEMAFTRSSDVERYLTSIGVEFKYRSRIPITRLTASWRSTNYARDKARLDDVVLEYAERMEGGSLAPAPIVHDIADGVELLDGLQRTSAADLRGETYISAYEIIGADKVTIHCIRIGANSMLNGHRPDPQFELSNAVRLLHMTDSLSATGYLQCDRVQSVACSGGNRTTADGECCSYRRLPRKDQEELAGLRIAAHAGAGSQPQPGRGENRWFEWLGKVDSKNGLAREVFERLGALKHKRHVRRVDQIKSVLDQFAKRPEINGKLHGRKRDLIDNAIDKLRGASTAVKNAKAKGHVIHDRAAINELKQLFQTIGYDINQMIEHDDPVFRVRTQA